jgi:predicted 3-demethylubiquinone-9 3-methyltransferase (glyoxalase superfamily)
MSNSERSALWVEGRDGPERRSRCTTEAEQCGWLKDRFSISWQIVPPVLGELLGNGTKEQTARVTGAFLQMKKFDIAVLKRAFEGTEARAGGKE